MNIDNAEASVSDVICTVAGAPLSLPASVVLLTFNLGGSWNWQLDKPDSPGFL